MSDFLVTFQPNEEASLLPLLRRPFEGFPPRAGRSKSFSWGSFGILRDALSETENYLDLASVSVGWVGDLVWRGGVKNFLASLAQFERLVRVSADAASLERAFREGFPYEHLNGAGALLLASDKWVAVILDPMSAVQVYRGDNASAGVPGAGAIGTHPDLVASLVSDRREIDPVSVAEFINDGTPSTPHTIYKHVSELSPGRVHLFWLAQGECQQTSVVWWKPPRELSGKIDEQELRLEFAEKWRAAVLARCVGARLGVQLSGGLDSRLVLAAIPRDRECLALTLTEGPNRETRIAQRVAQCYKRDWRPLNRSPEYLAETALASTRFTGCEGEWHHAHSIGFAGEISALGLDSVFTGLYMDNNFKGYYAKDLRQVSRLRGLLPPRFAFQKRDYVNRLNPFCREHLSPDLISALLDRRRALYESHFASGRSSEWEWLDGYPLTQASDNTGWIVERRVMPLRLPVMDRALVELAFKIPATLKAGGDFFRKAASLVLGEGNRIPNANDGVRPDSGQFSRVIQRSSRLMAAKAAQVASSLGAKQTVQHSWHNYQEYWRHSPALERLRTACQDQLAEFRDSVFQSFPAGNPWSLDRNWRVSYRILQLAIWRKSVLELCPEATPMAR